MMAAIRLALVLGIAIAGTGCTALQGPPVEYPAIAPSDGPGEEVVTEHAFLFEGATERLAVSVDDRLLEGARSAGREVLVRGEVPEKEWIAGAYRAQVADPAQDRFYADLLAGFREIRERRGLDPDRYLELLAGAVQQLPYVAAPRTAAKYPAETWSDRGGDCDDKALLLAGLLGREGYRVALLVFLPEAHMAVGVGCPDGMGWSGTDYAYLEATNATYVGSLPERIGDGDRLDSQPLVVPVGNGTTLYGAVADVRAIEAARETARARIETLGPEIDRRAGAHEGERERLEAPGSSGSRAAYDAALARYRAEGAAIDRLVDEHNRLVDLLNLTAASRYDRAGAADYLRANPP